jgi:hypothetical protein
MRRSFQAGENPHDISGFVYAPDQSLATPENGLKPRQFIE